MAASEGPSMTLVRRVVTEGLILLVRSYQRLLSPVLMFLGVQCRFEPTCSEYMAQSLRKYGPARGTLKGLARLGRCHPWHPGGFDPP
jgi:putative membrane protein insertion efficiency factor